jgi:hypothetical protein
LDAGILASLGSENGEFGRRERLAQIESSLKVYLTVGQVGSVMALLLWLYRRQRKSSVFATQEILALL